MATINGGTGSDLLDGTGVADLIVGFAGADTVNADSGLDTVRGLAGDDRLFGGAGADRIEGGAGQDSIDGGAARDSLFGGSGRDTILGQGGADLIEGNRFADELFGFGQRDRIDGGGGRDSMFGGGGRDTLFGGKGRDEIAGGAGRDEIFGDGGRDDIRGGAGDDSISGGRNGDTLNGGGGRDLILGGAANDLLTGGQDADEFIFTDGAGADTITDFAEEDILDLSAVDVEFDELVIEQTDAGALITHTAGSILLNGVNARTIDRDDFVLRADKPDLADEGDGSKVDTQTAEAGFDKPTVASGVGEISAQSNDAVGFTGLADFRADPRFAGIDGEGYSVVVIDTGIDLNHPAFGPDANNDGVSDRIVFSQDFSNDRDGTVDDVNGHGSNVTSIIASSDARFLGVAPGVDIISLQGLSNSGSGTGQGIEAAVQWVVDNAQAYNIVALNMSLGPPDNLSNPQVNSFLGDEFAALNELGVVTTVAAGNNYFEFQREGVQSIAADPNVIAVGAVWDGDNGRAEFGDGSKDFTTEADQITVFSQRSDDFGLIFAPGGGITGAGPGGGFITQSGTSQAAPFVAGVAVLAQDLAVQELGRRLTPEEFRTIALQTADTISDFETNRDNVVNTGLEYPRINVDALGEAILALAGDPDTPTPPPPSDGDVGDDVNTTGRIAVGETVRGTVDPGVDQDWYRIELEAGVLYEFTLSRDDDSFDFLSDPILVLRDATGAAMTQNDDSDGTLNSKIIFTPQTSGVFYLDAGSFSDETGDYVLTATQQGAAVTDDFPGDNSTPSVLRDDQTPTTGVIDTPGDRDRHRLNVEEGVEYNITLRGAGADALVDPFLRIFDDASMLIATNDDDGETLNSAITFEASVDGSIFIEAGAFSDAGTGGYEIIVEAVDQRIVGDLPSDGSTSAVVAVDGAPFEGVLEVAGDRDWIGVELQGGFVYDIALFGDGASPLADPLLRLFDPQEQLVGFNDDFDGLNSRIESFVADRSGTFFISAGSFSDFGAGGYAVEITQVGGGGAGDVAGDDSTTSTIAVDGEVTGSLEQDGDRDWYRAELIAGESYEISLAGVGGAGELSDPFLRVYNAQSTLLASDDDSGGGLDSMLTFTASTTGTFFLAAGGFSDRESGDYTLSLDRVGSGDDFPGGVETTGRLTGNDSLAGTLELEGDSDWIAFDVERGGVYQFNLDGDTGSANRLLDPFLTLRDQFGQQLDFNDDVTPGSNFNSQIDFFASESQTVYLDAGAFDNSNIVDVGDYISSTVISDGNDDFSNGFTGNLGDLDLSPSFLSGELEEVGDRDMFTIDLIAGRSYEFGVFAAPSGSGTLSDPTLQLFDPRGDSIAFNDDANFTRDPEINFIADETGTFFLRVAAFDDRFTGTYEIEAFDNSAASLSSAEAAASSVDDDASPHFDSGVASNDLYLNEWDGL